MNCFLGIFIIFDLLLNYIISKDLAMATLDTLETIQPLSPEIGLPPAEIYSDEPPLESNLHLRQILLLIECLEWLWKERDDFFATGNLTIYYSPNQRKSEDFRSPDFFVVLGVDKRPERKSWVVWHEGGKYPNVIIEILSDSTAKTDRGEKKQIYQEIFRTPEYFWFDPDTLEFVGFSLVRGQYQPIDPTESGRLWSEQLGLYLGVYERQLRYFTPDGAIVLTPSEAATQTQEQLESTQEQLESAQEQIEQLKAQLKQLGIDPV